MKFERLGALLPSWENALLAVIAAVMLILAFPDFEFWYLAWVALAPLLWAIEREKESRARTLILGWLFGTLFFFGTCWWLTFAPITYAGFPWILANFLMLCVALTVGLFPAVFAAFLAALLRRFGNVGVLAAPAIWVATEFLRYWITGNNWNALAYSQAFRPETLHLASLGGVYIISFIVASFNAFLYWSNVRLIGTGPKATLYAVVCIFWLAFAFFMTFFDDQLPPSAKPVSSYIVAIQPNVPMSGVDDNKLELLRRRQAELAETAVAKIRLQPENAETSTLVVLPESPMDYRYTDDRMFQLFTREFTTRNRVSLLFNSAEPDKGTTKYFNSAVMIGANGTEIAEYDKIFLLPFGEAVPMPLEGILPGFVGNFAYGREYDLVPVGDARAGIMICFESHFGQLSREYARQGADAIIEMTNDGYLGPTPVLRQHLANAVFRAAETNRPLFRVTNVGISAFINERGEAFELTPAYTEDTRIWQVRKSDGGQTFYVRFGDWVGWICTVVTLGLVGFAVIRRKSQAD